ncbi:SseB family protein [Streptomyces sp. YH02]|uniref:SseB family protein n=1 Tax=Streptomyces sp. YH02 TaxID=3256999 RepID=UPI003756D49C
MNQNGDETPKPQPWARLADLAEEPVLSVRPEPEPEPEPTPATARTRTTPDASPADDVAMARREFARLLGEFRRTAVLVPFDDHGSLWTADFNGVRWICAFSDEEALARFADARGDAAREWTYRTILGARLLDVMVPAASATSSPTTATCD